MAQTEKLYSSIADRNEAIYRLADQGKSPAEIAAVLNIAVQIVDNFLSKDD